MNNFENYEPPIILLRGQEINAIYRDPEIPKYRYNPLIEALPQIMTKSEAVKSLAYFPQYSQDIRNEPNHLRSHYIQDTLEFFIPLGIHIDLEQRISRIIRIGYLARNPILPGFWRNIKHSIDSIEPNRFIPRHHRSTAKSMVIIGVSGIGKTTAIEENLLLYPQIINHNNYLGRNFTLRQIVWLKLDCPHDGSIKGLCKMFFLAVDDLLGTNYCERYANGRQQTVDDMILNIARIASIQSLGLLVIDEVQNLSRLKSGGSQKMLSFFVQLINTIGLPVILVGTYKAWSVLNSEFRQIRRGTGQGDLVWDSMKEDDTWQVFVKALWRYQYVKKPCPLTPELSHVLYYESQGITDFAAKLYMLAQVRAISTGREIITPSIIQSVAKDSLRTARQVLNALKEKNTDNRLRLLMDCDDVTPIDIEPFLEEIADSENRIIYNHVDDNQPEIGIDVNQNQQFEQVKEISELNNLEINKEQNDIDHISNIKKGKNPKTINKKINCQYTLTEMIEKKASQGISAYEALKQTGYIKSPTEYKL
ncbi:Tn7-like transposition protein C [Calothrix sp. NIES-2100]|uniref:ATP-binding protein n=1 Tax=Calothrix sp. NIES-2100 TaxID=1954172 RepID=UPI000B60B63C|nr:Tn7-like transposition protein C [Calothrix sp. NIES-2100]